MQIYSICMYPQMKKKKVRVGVCAQGVREILIYHLVRRDWWGKISSIIFGVCSIVVG